MRNAEVMGVEEGVGLPEEDGDPDASVGGGNDTRLLLLWVLDECVWADAGAGERAEAVGVVGVIVEIAVGVGVSGEVVERAEGAVEDADVDVAAPLFSVTADMVVCCGVTDDDELLKARGVSTLLTPFTPLGAVTPPIPVLLACSAALAAIVPPPLLVRVCPPALPFPFPLCAPPFTCAFALAAPLETGLRPIGAGFIANSCAPGIGGGRNELLGLGKGEPPRVRGVSIVREREGCEDPVEVEEEEE
ncbi:hypothetical protein K438DRAFT_1878474 [Mycena galopus ATCC 62051]|nr:hypothetical protein K438DRAFT_1878474 [Mycena galopus ATCC 62051]